LVQSVTGINFSCGVSREICAATPLSDHSFTHIVGIDRIVITLKAAWHTHARFLHPAGMLPITLRKIQQLWEFINCVGSRFINLRKRVPRSGDEPPGIVAAGNFQHGGAGQLHVVQALLAAHVGWAIIVG